MLGDSALLNRGVPLVMAVGFILWASANAISPTPPWLQAPRAVGAPLAGYWALSPHAACYDDAAVYRFEADRMTLYNFPDVEPYEQTSISIVGDGRIRVDFSEASGPAGPREAIMFRDLGDRLQWESLVSNGRETPFAGPNKPGDLINCGAHSFGQRLALVLKRPFHVEDFSARGG